MTKMNQNYGKLPGNYLFSEIGRRAAAFRKERPDCDIISLGIGDVTRPLPPAVVDAMHAAVEEMGNAATFRGYGPDFGYDFLREKIAQYDFRARGADISPDEIFVSDGAKRDCGNIGDLFGADDIVAICDPVYPVYADTNAMAGRAGTGTRRRCAGAGSFI
jgi:LL-diaminopimelate aminotransferase